jgi:hypothetical protein
MSEKKKKNKRNVKESNIIPFNQKKPLQVLNTEENPINREKLETRRVNDYAKKYCKEIINFADQASISAEMVYYHFIFHMKQVAIMNLNYAKFKHLDQFTSKELAENLGEYLNEFPELWKEEESNKTIH